MEHGSKPNPANIYVPVESNSEEREQAKERIFFKKAKR